MEGGRGRQCEPKISHQLPAQEKRERKPMPSSLLPPSASPRPPLALLHIRRFRRRRRPSPQILSANSNWRTALPPFPATDGLTTALIGPSNAMHDGFFNWTPLFS